MTKKYDVSESGNQIVEMLRGTIISKLEACRNAVTTTVGVMGISLVAMGTVEDQVPEDMAEEFTKLKKMLDDTAKFIDGIQDEMLNFWEKENMKISLPGEDKHLSPCLKRKNRTFPVEEMSRSEFSKTVKKERTEESKVKGLRAENMSEEDRKKLDRIMDW